MSVSLSVSTCGVVAYTYSRLCMHVCVSASPRPVHSDAISSVRTLQEGEVDDRIGALLFGPCVCLWLQVLLHRERQKLLHLSCGTLLSTRHSGEASAMPPGNVQLLRRRRCTYRLPCLPSRYGACLSSSYSSSSLLFPSFFLCSSLVTRCLILSLCSEEYTRHLIRETEGGPSLGRHSPIPCFFSAWE